MTEIKYLELTISIRNTVRDKVTDVDISNIRNSIEKALSKHCVYYNHIDASLQ